LIIILFFTKEDTRLLLNTGIACKTTGNSEERRKSTWRAGPSLNHARQLTRGWLIFVPGHTPTGRIVLHALFAGLAAVRANGRILQLKILLCHEYDEYPRGRAIWCDRT